MAERLEDSQALESTTVNINRTSTTVKGGRRLSFSALVVVGDRGGNVGIGYGKGRGVPIAIEKAQKDAKKNLTRVDRSGGTLPHPVTGRFSSSKVRLIPAAPGTGVVAGGTVRAVLEMAGVRDCLTKSYGSTNEINLCKAVMEGLLQLRSREAVAELRGVTIQRSAVDEMLEASRQALIDAESSSSSKKDSGGGDRGRGRGDREQRNQGGGGGGVKSSAASQQAAKSGGRGGKGGAKKGSAAKSEGGEQPQGDQQTGSEGNPLPTEEMHASAAPHAPEHIDQSADAHDAVSKEQNEAEDNLKLQNIETPTAEGVASGTEPVEVEASGEDKSEA